MCHHLHCTLRTWRPHIEATATAQPEVEMTSRQSWYCIAVARYVVGMSTVAAGVCTVAGAAGMNRAVVLAADIVTVVVESYMSAGGARTAVKNSPVVTEVAVLGSVVSPAYLGIAGVAAGYIVPGRTRLVGRNRTESLWLAGSAGSVPLRLLTWASESWRRAVDEDLEKPSGLS